MMTRQEVHDSIVRVIGSAPTAEKAADWIIDAIAPALKLKPTLVECEAEVQLTLSKG